MDCSGLMTVILGDGLEEIGEWAFSGKSLVRIDIPPAIKTIDAKAFKRCSDLTTITFCDKIEEFVSGESMRGWWNNGVHEKCLSTYCLLVRFNIPERLSLVRSTTWQTNIHGMLERIPSISPKGLNAHFDSIDSKLSAYEGSTMLELAIWKSKIEEQTDGNINLLPPDMKMGCRNDSQSTVGIICRHVLLFFSVATLMKAMTVMKTMMKMMTKTMEMMNSTTMTVTTTTVTKKMTTVTKTMKMMLMKAMMVMKTMMEMMTKTMEMMNLTTMTVTMTTVTKKMKMINTNSKSKVRYLKLIGCF